MALRVEFFQQRQGARPPALGPGCDCPDLTAACADRGLRTGRPAAPPTDLGLTWLVTVALAVLV